MPLLAHLKELRTRLIISLLAFAIAFVLAYVFFAEIYLFLTFPLKKISSSFNENNLFVTSLLEGFLIKFKVSMLSSIIISFPVHVFNLIKFIFPALHRKEKKILIIILFCSFILFFSSFSIVYQKIIPYSVTFLTGSNFIQENVGLLLNYGQNIIYIFQFLFFSLMVFQLPIVLFVMIAMGLVKRSTLISQSRYLIIIIFILSAIITPPDPVSQLSVALPLILLFFITIFIAKILRLGGD